MIKYDYKVNDLILFYFGTLQRKVFPKRDGPYQVIKIYSKSTHKICMDIYVQRVSIRQCIPYFNSPNDGSETP
jgi:hypothetical protein